MSGQKKVTCPKCMGSKEVFNGKYIRKCRLCDKEGLVTRELEQSYIDEQLPYE